MHVDYEWDENKRIENIDKHGIDFMDVHHFEWDTARVMPDTRKDYAELRYLAYGYIEERLTVLCFTLRGGAVRIISLRKANSREVTRYGQ